MNLLLSFFVTVLVLCLVFSLAYWIVTLIGSIIPVPVRQPATTILLILLALMALCCLLDLTGVFGGRHLLISLGH